VNEPCLKLTVYFGERDRARGRFLADAVIDIYARHELQTSVLFRGVEGFGAKQRFRTDRLLTLSEDLPLVSVAVDAPARIQGAVAEIDDLRFDGLVTLERGRMLTGDVDPAQTSLGAGEAAKLTVYVGRHERAGHKAAYESVVDLLRRRGVAGATVLLGVDGTLRGVRRRARFFGANAEVPLMIIAVGHGPVIGDLLPELAAMLDRPAITLERIRVCKRDGQRLAAPLQLPETDPSGLGVWHKLMVYAGEQARAGDQPLSHELIRALRQAGASGATSLRGIWGYHGDHQPHGDSFWQLRRRVPIVTVIVDSPERAIKWYRLVDELTTETGLVTSEMVPAFRATGPNLEHGDLRLAQLGDPGQPRPRE
jgi:PII-like signaling protein